MHAAGGCGLRNCFTAFPIVIRTARKSVLKATKTKGASIKASPPPLSPPTASPPSEGACV
ncbi:hypothetical protein E2C01_038986 [Portunus trituberculatus]|uniref:Uncharacterized protein n=1 Tax=Portunus trituberculatus TaxID=210409 RepID=A0A5B7FDL2_PORTR|nr:hypothetical protein [Portunus trituberculatus]